jgi:hypothetical protein
MAWRWSLTTIANSLGYNSHWNCGLDKKNTITRVKKKIIIKFYHSKKIAKCLGQYLRLSKVYKLIFLTTFGAPAMLLHWCVFDI